MISVPSIAVWGSLGASVVLGVFMLVQAFMDPPRRGRFALFAVVWWILAALDSLQPYLGISYEMLRVLWCGAYAGSLLWLLEFSISWAITSAFSIPVIGIMVWSMGHPELATTTTFPLAFGIAAVVHGIQYWSKQGYASCVLCVCSTSQAIMCALYFLYLKIATTSAIADNQIVGLGYTHYAVISIISALLGWVHLPRELRGRSPVKVHRLQGITLFGVVVTAEVGIQVSLLLFYSWPPILYLVISVFQLAAMLLLYFYRSHLLVIHTDNVTQLLEERTSSLRQAQQELSHQNEIQAQKLQEQARELQAKAEVIDRQRRLELAAQTAGQAAHDIQNLISPLLVHISQLQRDVEHPVNVRNVADKIRSQVEHLLNLNSQLLALSRRGRMDLHPVYINELLESLRDHFPKRRLVIQSKGDAWINGSWAQLSRAVSNLITNAFEATSSKEENVTVRGGAVEIYETKRCHLGFLDKGNYAYVEVEDTGPGIPDNIREQIFEPFFSTKNSGQHSGSGLGLSIVAAIVDDHKGVLDLRTGPEGTCFTIYLPAIASPTIAVDTSKLSGNETVMVVDDDASILQQYGKMLEEVGYSVITAQGGEEALRMLQVEQVDLLLLDLKMPRRTGFETFFGAIHLRPGIRAIVHSSYITSEEALRLRELGVSALLQKPASRLEVLRTVRQILDEQPIATEIVDKPRF